MNSQYLGISKTIFNSSAAVITARDQVEVFLTERLDRKKNSGQWPQLALLKINEKYPNLAKELFFENRDVETPGHIENLLNASFPFYESLEKKGLSKFLSHSSQSQFVTHHLAHAYSSLFLNPFEQVLILVIDGAGNRAQYFTPSLIDIPPAACEERSLFLWNQKKLNLLDKKWQLFEKSSHHSEHFFSQGLGSLYEKASEFIFNSKTQAGKVMGLAPFGKPENIINRIDFLNSLDWAKSFKGGTKSDWENHSSMTLFQNLAATVQLEFEKDLLSYIAQAKKEHPEVENLILAGGCALNCTANMKIQQTGLFKNVFITPFPGDEGLSVGLAFKNWLKTNEWTPMPMANQISYWGPVQDNDLIEQEIIQNFSSENYYKPENLVTEVEKILNEEVVIAFFQGRSEIGPRALGHRSLIALPQRQNLKNYLNQKVKFRESFRPYGCVVPQDKAYEYFDVPQNFTSSFMAFACPVRPHYFEPLKEVSHIDGTSRMQTLNQNQNPLLFSILKQIGRTTGLECLLNTSLNIMNEPIVETVQDLKRFLNSSNVKVAVVGEYIVRLK